MDMQQLMKQAQELQKKVSEAQNHLDKVNVKGISAGGLCIIEMTGKYDIISVKLQPDLLKEDIEMIQDVIKSALSDAKTKADTIIDQVMSQATAGMPMPQ